MGILKESTSSLQNTINQLLHIQQQSVQKDINFSAESQQTLADSQKVFLENQSQYQVLNKQIAKLTTQQHQLEKKLVIVSKQIRNQHRLAKGKYKGLMSKHRLKVAALKLAFLLPIFLILAWLFIKKRSGTICGPIIYAAFIAVFVKLSFVAHEYFPSRYFKYIAILVIIAIVLGIVIYLLKRVVSPKRDLLVKQYREAYDKNVCPICSKPIRIGVLRYITKSRGKTFVLTEGGAKAGSQQPYVCPSCGTELYGKCDKCNDIRHSLLPFCEHCGSERSADIFELR